MRAIYEFCNNAYFTWTYSDVRNSRGHTLQLPTLLHFITGACLQIVQFWWLLARAFQGFARNWNPQAPMCQIKGVTMVLELVTEKNSIKI